MKRIRVFAYDHLRRFVRGDEILHAIPPGRILCLGTVWTGKLAPEVEGIAAALADSFVAPGLSTGRVLHAEPAPEVLDMGRQWLGTLATKLLAASADFASARRPEEAGPEPGTDVTEVVAQLDRLRRDMGTAAPAKIADGLRRLQDAARRVSDSARRRSTGDARATARDRITSINSRNTDFWGQRSVTPRLDDSGRMNWRSGDAAPTQRPAFRDAMHAARQATTPRDRITAMNRAAKSFWSSGVTADTLGRAPAPNSIAEINARARQFWAGRS